MEACGLSRFSSSIHESMQQIPETPSMGKSTRRASFSACKGKEPLGQSRNSSHMKRAMMAREIDELCERISALEEETATVKQPFFDAMRDRDRLVEEVYQCFKDIPSSLHIKSERLASSPSVALAADSIEKESMLERKVGLSLILCQDSTPFMAMSSD